MVVMKPALMPNFSSSSLTMAAMELVVQEPAETITSEAFRMSWFTPNTTVGVVVVLGRGGDQDLLGASVDVSLGLLGGGVEAGALEHVLNTVVLDPRDVVGVLLGVDLVFLAVDDDGVFGGLDVNRSAIVMTEGAVGAVVLQQVGQA